MGIRIQKLFDERAEFHRNMFNLQGMKSFVCKWIEMVGDPILSRVISNHHRLKANSLKYKKNEYATLSTDLKANKN